MSLELTIVTPERQAYTGQVESVLLPGSEGDFGVLAGHERFLSPLRIGEVAIRQPKGVTYAALSEGFAEVTGARVVVMVDSCELATDIDVARAERAKAAAERDVERLRREQASDHRLQMAETALQRALLRISVAGRP